jgi:uncharacterized protein with HEPN domain
VRLRHMLDAANDAMAFVRGKKRSDLDNERLLVLGLMKAIEIIGEAASRISDETCAELPDVPWPDVIGMRNRLVHGYYDINLNILWKTVEELPLLAYAVERALAK